MEKEPLHETLETEKKEASSLERNNSAAEKTSSSDTEAIERITELKNELKESSPTESIREQVDHIESVLEENARSEKNTKKKSRPKWTALFIAAFAALSPLASREDPGKTIAKENAAYIEKELGFDFAERATKNGFTFSLDVKNPEGKYVVHIGQTHAHYDREKKEITWSQNQIASQKNIEKLLLSFNQSSPATVFTEGVACEEKDSSDMESAKALNQLLSTVEKTEITHEKAERLLNVLKTATHALAVYRETKTTLQPYLVASAIIKLTENIKLKAPQEFIKGNAKLAAIEAQIQTIRQTSGLTPEDMPYTAGAVQKLYAEGKIILRGSEKLSTNLEGATALEAYKNAGLSLKQARTELEIQEAVKKIRETKKLFEKHSKEDREAVALEIIQKGVAASKEKIIPLVYGAAHDFQDQVEIRNNEHPEHRLGLITLQPIDH